MTTTARLPFPARLLTGAVCLLLALVAAASLRAAEPAPWRIVLTGQSLIRHDLRVHAPDKFRALRPLLHGRDLVFTNLETAIDVGVGKPIKDEYLHASPVAVLDCLRELGVNVLALSNNHIGDLGPEGVMGAIGAVRERGFAFAGAGRSIVEAAAPGFLAVPAGRVALIAGASGGGQRAGPPDSALAGMNEIRRNREEPAKGLHPDDVARVLADIRAAARAADFVIVYHHDHLWGADMQATAPWKREWARACIDHGAHVFVSHGAPLLHGIELHRGRPIFYGLGNLVFHTRTKPGHYPPTVWQSVVVEGTLAGAEWQRLTITPIVLNESGESASTFLQTRGMPSPAAGREAAEILSRLSEMSAAFGTQLEIKGDTATVTFP